MAIDPARLAFDLTREDLLALRAHARRDRPESWGNPGRSYWSGLKLGLFPLMLVCFVLVLGRVPAPVYLVVLVPALVVIALWTYHFRSKWLPAVDRHFEHATAHLIGPHVFEITEDGPRDAGPAAASSHRWTAVESVHDGLAHIFIRVIGSAYYTVPKRAFADAGDATRFAEEVRQRSQGSASEAGGASASRS